jgi:transposase
MTTDKTTSHSTKLANYASQVAGYKTIVSTQLATPVFAGIDVGAEELFLVIRKNAVSMKAQAFTNTPAERQRLVKRLSHFPGVTVCLEATGVYYLDLALALADAGVRLMVLNPKASHNFAKVLLRNSKTDAVDADTLAQYVERMPYQPWARPANEALALRAFARRVNAITKDKTAAKNQLHALAFSRETPKGVLRDLKLAIVQMEKRILRLSAEAKKFVLAHPTLAHPFVLLLTVKGIGDASAIALLGELMLLPDGLSHKQWVQYAGLDPRHFKSGTSVEKRARISKAGNRYIRQALYMPALSAKDHDPHVKGFFDHLVANGKTKMQGVCAVMRKLLHAIHGMLTHNQPFDNSRFYALPA